MEPVFYEFRILLRIQLIKVSCCYGIALDDVEKVGNHPRAGIRNIIALLERHFLGGKPGGFRARQRALAPSPPSCKNNNAAVNGYLLSLKQPPHVRE